MPWESYFQNYQSPWNGHFKIFREEVLYRKRWVWCKFEAWILPVVHQRYVACICHPCCWVGNFYCVCRSWDTDDMEHNKTATYWGPHYIDAIMGTMASQISCLTVVYSTVYSCADQWKHQISASLAFVRGIHRWPVNSPQKWPVTRKMFPLDDVVLGLL